MKKIIYISLASIILLFSGCDDFLDLKVKSDYTPGSYFVSQEAAVKSVTGVYNSLYGMKWWVFGDVASDDAVKGGNAGDQADINYIDDFSASSDNGIISVFWQDTYETIIQANNVIEYIKPIEMNDAMKNRLVGEVKFLRAFSYFQLVNIFGKVPYKDLPQTSYDAIHVPLSEVSYIYSKIENDLLEAIASLPISYDASDRCRVTRGAAHGLLAKVYLYQEKYAQCLAQIANLEALGIYDLEDNYEDLFKRGAEDSKEVIFGLRYVVDDLATLGNEYNVWMAPSHENGYYFNAPTQSYVDAFTESTTNGNDDPRLDASIGRDGQPWFNGEIFSRSWSEATGYLVKKYNEDITVNVPKSQSTLPYHYLRYADILLMKAEALNESASANVQLAATEVNKVRRRASLASTTADTQNALRQVIRNERRKELGFEFHRFYDLMRWGKAVAEEALGPNFTWQEPRFYFPIPQEEVDANQAI